MRKIASFVALFVISLLSLSLVSALDRAAIDVRSVEVNGDDVVRDGVTIAPVLSVEEGQTLHIRVGLSALGAAPNGTVKDVEVDAKIAGYEYSDSENLVDATPLFDVQGGTTKYVSLDVTLPKKLDKDTYTLRLRIMDKNTAALPIEVPLYVEPSRHGIDIADVSFSPGNSVKAGRSLLTTVLLQNFGDKDEEDVKVTVAIPALGVSASDFVDVETDNHNVDYEDVPEMFLAIPASAQDGDYEVVVTAKYNDLRSTVSKKFTVHVDADERFQTSEEEAAGVTVLAVGPEMQSVAAGKTALYGIALSNGGRSSKAYVLQTQAAEWATVSLSESVLVLGPGQSKVVYAEVTPSATATAGEHLATVAVKSGSETLETVSLRAVVSAAAQSSAVQQQNYSLRSGLEIALIVLVVLLVIVGLIIGFTRLRKDGEEDKTYY